LPTRKEKFPEKKDEIATQRTTTPVTPIPPAAQKHRFRTFAKQPKSTKESSAREEHVYV
jgi:hypothetical protein